MVEKGVCSFEYSYNVESQYPVERDSMGERIRGTLGLVISSSRSKLEHPSEPATKTRTKPRQLAAKIRSGIKIDTTDNFKQRGCWGHHLSEGELIKLRRVHPQPPPRHQSTQWWQLLTAHPGPSDKAKAHGARA